MGRLVGVGNPLLDMSAPVPQQLLDRYQVKVNDALLAEDRHNGVYDELLQHYQVTYTAGGATQNTMRLAQWLLPPHSTAYMGCVGKDEFAQRLKAAAEADGVEVHYLINEQVSTGRCAVLLKDKERCLITQLGAANHYQVEHLAQPDVVHVIQSADIIYSAGFFLTVSPPSLMKLALHCAERNKILAGNISAPFIAQFFSEPLMAAMPYYDYLFGNESEAEALGTKLGFGTSSIAEIAEKLANHNKVNTKRLRHVIFTQGAQPTVVAIAGQAIQFFDVPLLKPELIVDLNGAGDAFVGGFLSQVLKNKPLERCVQTGHYAARSIIQSSGVVINSKPDPSYLS